MSLFCPNGVAYSGIFGSTPTPQTFSISGSDPATGVVRLTVNSDNNDPFLTDVKFYFASTATGVYVTLYGSYNMNSEIFKIPSGVTDITVVGTDSSVFTITTGQMI